MITPARPVYPATSIFEADSCFHRRLCADSTGWTNRLGHGGRNTREVL